MLDFTGVKAITIPEGSAAKITRKSDGTVLWQKVTSRLPSAYQEVEYIEGDGNCAIASDILSNDYRTTGLIVSAKLTWSGWINVDGFCLFCSTYSPVRSWFHIQKGYYAQSQRSAWYTSTVQAPINEIFEIEARLSFDYNGYLKVNGETILSGLRNYSDIDFENAYLYLCGYNCNGNFLGTQGWSGKCYWCTVKDLNGNIVGEFIPCYRKSDGAIGLYNLTTSTFCEKIGYGTFTKGANV